MAELVNKKGTGFAITCMGLEPTAPDYVILSMSMLQCHKVLYEADRAEWRSVNKRDLERFVNGAILSTLSGRAFYFEPQVPEFRFRHTPTGRVTFSIDLDRDEQFKLSGNYLMIDFQCTVEDIAVFAENLGTELDELEEATQAQCGGSHRGSTDPPPFVGHKHQEVHFFAKGLVVESPHPGSGG